jgi:MFS family permease
MWIWVAMLDLKIHALKGKSLHSLYGPILVPAIIAVTALTAASFYLNGVFAFAISVPGKPEIRPAFAKARAHIRTILLWGGSIGLALSFSALIATRWGRWPFAIAQSIVVGIMMLCYLAVPARMVGVDTKRNKSRRDALAASAVGGAVGAVVCSPPYMLGRFGILMLGWHGLFWLGVILIVIGAALQTGATSAVKAVKFSAKLVGHPGAAADAAAAVAEAGPEASVGPGA